jgi:hypothetical protein
MQMKKIILVASFITTVLFASCVSPNDDGIYTTNTRSSNEYLYDELRTITVADKYGELCEYVLYDRGITHNGNCKYCKARHDKENDSLVEIIANKVYTKLMNK